MGGQHFLVNTYLIKQYRYFCLHIIVFILLKNYAITSTSI